MENLFSINAIISLLTLTFLEIILGIDNIIFISIASSKLPEIKQKKARNWGLILAMAFRVILLFGISYIISLRQPFAHFTSKFFTVAPSGQSIILAIGGFFLLYKATNEIFEKMEGDPEKKIRHNTTLNQTISKVIIQIALINLVFSIDSILTAIGLTSSVPIMISAVVISGIIMILFSGPVGHFVNIHPSLQVLGLSFLIMIGFMLIAEASHLAELVIFNYSVGTVPKGYLYFAIAFSLGVEFVNIRIRKKSEE